MCYYISSFFLRLFHFLLRVLVLFYLGGQGSTQHTTEVIFLFFLFFLLGELFGGWKANEKIKGSCFLFVCLVSRKWIEKGREREREWKSMEHKFGVQCATEISAAAARTCGSPSYFYTIFF